MKEKRLFIRTTCSKATQIFQEVDAILEDSDCAASLVEIDEKNDLHEFSIYVNQDKKLLENYLVNLCNKIGIPNTLEEEVLEETDWVKKSLENLPPIYIKPFFIHGSHDREKCPLGSLSIEIEAGLAFGTGHHPTTKACLEMMLSIIEQENPKNALDLGTGSAILALAMAKLKPSLRILATDTDPIAIKTANENIKLNESVQAIETVCATGFNHPIFNKYAPFNLIVANILAQPLVSLAPEMAQFTESGGSLVLSGILESFHESVLYAYRAQGFQHITTIQEQEWVTLHFKRLALPS